MFWSSGKINRIKLEVTVEENIIIVLPSLRSVLLKKVLVYAVKNIFCSDKNIVTVAIIIVLPSLQKKSSCVVYAIKNIFLFK